jgi:23S rRNA (adenine2503-C2)-methyltransferase
MSRALEGLTLGELTGELGSRHRAVAAIKWLHGQGAAPRALPGELAGVSREAWGRLIERHGLTVPEVVGRQVSADGTTKYALALEGATVEAVLIPARGRSTVCVSSQAGCTRRCSFCATKELGFTRQLRAEEMVAQFMLARGEAPAGQPATNVVFMGMGEPMDNLDEVLRAVEILMQNPAPQLRAEAVTVSTSGVAPGMERFLASSRASLALSLNATTDSLRQQLMPHNRTWPIAALLDVLRAAARRSPRRETFVEYVLLDGLNDGDEDADRLVALLEGLPARVNLIPCNPYAGGGLGPPPLARIKAFHRRVADKGQICLVRWPRGTDIAAACGQLALAQVRPRP